MLDIFGDDPFSPTTLKEAINRAEFKMGFEMLPIWVVYNSPSDYPGAFVARRWSIARGGIKPTTEIFIATSLDDLRAMLPPGLTCLRRAPDDDVNIVECWI